MERVYDQDDQRQDSMAVVLAEAMNGWLGLKLVQGRHEEQRLRICDRDRTWQWTTI